MKRILYIASNPFNYERVPVGGYISSALGIISGLGKSGYSVDILTDSDLPGFRGSSPQGVVYRYSLGSVRRLLPTGGECLTGRALRKFDALLFQAASFLTIVMLLKKNQYDIFYVRASYNAHMILRALSLFHGAVILEVNKPLSMARYNSGDSLQWPSSLDRVKVKRCEREMYRRADLISVDSSVRARWITEFVGSEFSSKLFVNPNGVDIQRFSPYGDWKGGFFQRYSAVDQPIIIGMASSFRWYNDISELADIISLVKTKKLNVRFVLFVGDEKRLSSIKSEFFKKGISDIAEYQVQVPFLEMPNKLAGCDILISHFNFHGGWPHNCSIKHLEYLAMGKPVVATNVGEVNFAVEHMVNGILCDEGDVQAFAEAICMLCVNERIRMRLGKAGRSKAEHGLSWDAGASKLISQLESIRSQVAL